MDSQDSRKTTNNSNNDTFPSPFTSLTDSDQLNAWLSGGATAPAESNLSTVGSMASATTVPTMNVAGGFFTNPVAATTTTTAAAQPARPQKPPQKSPPLPPRAPPPAAVAGMDDRAATTETSTHHEPTTAGGRTPVGVLKKVDRSSAALLRPKTETATAPSDRHGATTGNSIEASTTAASPPIRGASHQRKVSWGDTQQQQQRLFPAEVSAVTTEAPLPTAPLSPPIIPVIRSNLSDVSSMEDTGSPPQPIDSRHNRMMSALTYSSRQMTTSTMDSLQGANIVNLDAILKVNPLESEAETLILKVIESQDNVNRRARTRTDTVDSNLLPNVPTEAINVFGPVDTFPAPQSSESLLANNSNVGRPPSLHASTESRRTTTSKPPPTKDRPNQTMEQTLAGLSEALKRTATHGSASGPDSRSAEQQSAVPTSAGAALAKNVSVLFGERQKTSGSVMKDPTPSTHAPPPAAPPPVLSVGIMGRQKTSGSTTKMEPDDSGEELPSPSSSSAGRKNWSKLRNLVRVTSVSSQHQQPSTGDEDPSNASSASRRSAVEKTHGIHQKTDSNQMSEICDRIEETGEEEGAADDVEAGVGIGASREDGKNEAGGSMRRKRPLFRSKFAKSAQVVTKNNLWRDFLLFFSQRRAAFFTYLRILFFLEVPAVAVAFVLFYALGNPPTGRVDLSRSEGGIYVREGDGEILDPLEASASWWILFICVRQGLTFTLAQLLEVIIIDFFCLSSRLFVSVLGNLVTLLIVQARGWPFVFFMWGILDFALLYGSSRFANHWIWFQDFIRIFNESNPGGSITSNIWYTRVLSIAVSVSVVVAIKRLWLGLYLGKKTFKNYAGDLAKVVQKLVTLADVASLARMFQVQAMEDDRSVRQLSVSRFGISREEFDGMVRNTIQAPGEEEAEPCSIYDEMNYSSGRIVDPEDCDADGDLKHSQKRIIKELLGEWEEPENSMAVEDDVSIGGILQFRHSLSFLDGRYMFSIAWGDVSTRERAVLSSQEVYSRLLLRTPDEDVLKFDVLALAATKSNSDINVSELKNLIRLFRPDRDGKLALLDFVKSVDSVYKEARLLRASVRNSEKIDRAFENFINVVFYLVVACVVLSQIGYDPLALFLSLSSVILAFAFMIGAASSKMFEGWLFILLRRPYDIGDRIHISDPESNTSADGSAGWIVKDVNLYSTTVLFATTNERATLSNGSLANSRIINMARSPNAIGYIYFKFATGVPYERVQIFEKALTQFIKDRPREWVGLQGFRATQVMADQGYIEYVAVVQHRESWQNVTTYLVSKAQVASFCLEVAKKLNMRYRSPPLPVDLALVKNYTRGQDGDPDHQSTSRMEGMSLDDPGIQEILALFDSKKDK